jgi:[acyl-carrier-protein] S-malonyltransferase
MTRRRALIVVPGRGSYDRASLGQLAQRSEAATAVIDACDTWRAQHGRTPVRDLDAESSFRASRHLAGEHASLLTLACSLADLADLDADRYEIVGVCGNSMGWYGALAVASALPLADAIALVDTMGAYQEANVIGGQVIYPLFDGEEALADRVERALEQVRAQGGNAWWSIDLGPHAVLGADEEGVRLLLDTLPPIKKGDRTFPSRLPMHSGFHTPLLQSTSERALVDLSHLSFRAPTVPLIDGRGQIFRPRWADPREIAAYTLGAQVTSVYRFDYGLRTALSHCGPDVVVALGPGNSLGGAIAHALTRERWRGAADRESFNALQRSEEPVLLSFGIPEQRALLTHP